VKQGDFIDVLPGPTTLIREEGENAGKVFVQLLDGSGWTFLNSLDGLTTLEEVVPEEVFVVDRPGYWTIGRVSALIIGNHEILKEGNRWEADQGGQAIDPSSTLTHAGQCSLIEAIRQGHFEAPNAPLGGMLRYDDVVGAKADIFVSFAYSCDFLELVDALERFFENSPDLDKNSTYLWFDLFVNDQWTALDKPFEWWATTFKEAVEEIGHTVVVMLPWEAPIPLTRVWCLFEIACSKKLSIALSSTQVKMFHDTLRRSGGIHAITASLCHINVENATSFLPEDREKIFAVVAERKGSFHGLNVEVSAKLREWVEAVAKELVTPEAICLGDVELEGEDEEALANLFRLGNIYFTQGKLDEAADAWTRTLQGRERVLGLEHKDTLRTMGSLAIVFQNQGKLVRAQTMLIRALEGQEKTLGLEHSRTLTTMNNLGNLYADQGKLDKAEALLRRALFGREKVLGADHANTLATVTNLAVVFEEQGELVEAQAMYVRALKGQEQTLGLEHPSTLLTMHNLALLFDEQGKLDDAEALYMRALAGRQKSLGVEHAHTKTTSKNLARVQQQQIRAQASRLK